ncbi:hypothetical protein [uncultured Nostoc sp.]|uniref:hypothetical protein n=1 Tax=uncultured Nostoc sp. TaxID=340711 RepID=UPI00263623DB|nr:hypothetical protein [uncultured Nostoc sp.]
MADLNSSGTGNSSSSGNDVLKDSPWGRLSEVLPKDKGLSDLFSGVGKGEGSGSSPFGGSGTGTGSKPDLAYGGNPFAGDNFSNIFAGGKNPSAGGANQGSATDPLTGVGSKGSSISTTEIPDGLSMRGTIDNLVNSRLKEAQVGSGIPSSSGGKPPFGGSGAGGGISSFSGGGADGGLPPLGGGGADGGLPPFGGGGADGGKPPFGGGGAGGGIPFG